MYQTKSRFIDEIDKKFINTGYDNTPRQNYSAPAPAPKRKLDQVVGKMVEHEQMGSGVIIAENEKTLTVAFKKCGIKNVMREFVKFI